VLRISPLCGATWRFEVHKIIEATERQVKQVDVVANGTWEEASRKGEAARDAIDGRLRLREERRHARIALGGHSITGERDFRSARWRAR
jgi:hypothetical protein